MRPSGPRTKTLDVFAPCCGAKMTVEYDLTCSPCERLSDLPARCPRGHLLTGAFLADDYVQDMQDALHAFADQRARDGVGDRDERDLCGFSEGQRRA